jgi:hypothetical protein
VVYLFIKNKNKNYDQIPLDMKGKRALGHSFKQQKMIRKTSIATYRYAQSGNLEALTEWYIPKSALVGIGYIIDKF